MVTVVIILSATTAFLLGVVVGALGVFAIIGTGKRKPPIPSGLMRKLQSDLSEIPDDWEPGEAGTNNTRPLQGGGLPEEGIHSIEPE